MIHETATSNDRALREAHEKLIQAEKLTSLGRLIAGVAHEVNNPLNFVQGNLDLLNNNLKQLITFVDTVVSGQGGRSEELAETIERMKQEMDLDYLMEDTPQIIASIRNGVRRTINIVEDLRMFSRKDEGKPCAIDLNEAVETALRLILPKLSKRWSIKKDFADQCYLAGQKQQIVQIILNLLSNAIDAMDQNAGDSLLVSTRTRDKTVELVVEDNGIGMTSEQQAKLFEPFYTTKPAESGTGLGLYIVDKIVKRHMGSIEVSSVIHKGTRFKVIMPRCASPDLAKE